MGVLRVSALFFLSCQQVAASPVVVVTGATGKTGALLFGALKAQGVEVRGLVRNSTKARQVLNCTKCDTSEGIYIGDVTKKETLTAAMEGATVLAIVTSAVPHCANFHDPTSCSYSKGGMPVDIDFNGAKAQVEAFTGAQRDGADGHVVLCSSMGTTEPNSFLDKLGNGQIGFFKLNEEAFLMSSGLPFTIVKPCGLTDDPPGQRQLVVGHDDDLHLVPPAVPRADVARVMVESIMRPDEGKNLRFDLCSKAGEPTTDLGALLAAARWPWEQPTARAEIAI